jgi:hypothetical protein
VQGVINVSDRLVRSYLTPSLASSRTPLPKIDYNAPDVGSIPFASTSLGNPQPLPLGTAASRPVMQIDDPHPQTADLAGPQVRKPQEILSRRSDQMYAAGQAYPGRWPEACLPSRAI